MGGYGALLLAERHPGLLSAVAAISPAVWTTYAESRSANAGAFASAADFAAHDIIAPAPALGSTAIRIASGRTIRSTRASRYWPERCPREGLL